MITVVLATHDVAGYPDGGGHFWVYLHYALGLQEIGCDVFWLERQGTPEAGGLEALAARLEHQGLRRPPLFYSPTTDDPFGAIAAEVRALAGRADLLLNFEYQADPRLLAQFRRTALVDIDPGMLQHWMCTGQLRVPDHDVHFTIGERIGVTVPDASRRWHRIRPPVSLSAWPDRSSTSGETFTTVSSWWGGKGRGEWMVLHPHATFFDNNKRTSFLRFSELPRRTAQPLELALSLGDARALRTPAPEPEVPGAYASETEDCAYLAARGWRLRHAVDVARTPEQYRAYVQGSRGEFSCAKPAYVAFENAWVSDRTLCYLASGRPAVVQHTGPSSDLPDGEGLFRFRTIDEAADALAAIDANPRRHGRAARAIAETHFDARKVVWEMLKVAL